MGGNCAGASITSGANRQWSGPCKADQGHGKTEVHCRVHVHAGALNADLPNRPITAQVPAYFLALPLVVCM